MVILKWFSYLRSPFLKTFKINMRIKNYESVIVLTPVLSDEQMKDTLAKYRQFLTDNGAQIIHEHNWGLTKLAYPIQNKVTGFYHVYEFSADTAIIAKLEIAYRRDEKIMRFLTTALDKHALVYNQRKRNGEFANKAPKAAPAEASPTGKREPAPAPIVKESTDAE